MALRIASSWLLVLTLLVGCGSVSRSASDADAIEARGDLDGAIAAWRERFDAGGRVDAEAATHVGMLALQRGDLALAEEWLQTADRLQPDQPRVTAALARGAFLSGDYARADGLLRPLVAKFPNDPTYRAELARVAFAAHEYPEAATQAERALHDGTAPDPALWTLLGQAEARVGRVDRAEEAYRRAMALAPDDAAPCYYLGRLYDDLELPGQAVEMFRQALRLCPGFVDAGRDLGTVLLRQGDVEGAVLALENARALAPDDAGLLNNLGVAQRQAGHLPEARATFEQALAVGGESRAIAMNLADTCLHQGDFVRAQAVLVDAIARNVARRDDVLELEKLLVVRAYHEVVCERAGAFDKASFQGRLAALRHEAALDQAEQPRDVLAAVLADQALKTLLDEANQRCLATPK